MLTRCLGLPGGANLVIFADETTLSTALLLVEQADALEMQPVLAYSSVLASNRCQQGCNWRSRRGTRFWFA